jgi:hypothetical protein
MTCFFILAFNICGQINHSTKLVPIWMSTTRAPHEGLEALPEPELSEIVSSAIRLCGFVDPVEARHVIAIVLDAIEMKSPIPEEGASEGLGIALCDA